MGFPRSLSFVLEREGGLVNDPHDPGGLTKYGISKRQYPDLDIANLTLAKAQEIYHRDYWQPIRGDEMPDSLAFVVFDSAVNQGVSTATRLLQRTLRIDEDGKFGPATLAAAKASGADAVGRFCAERVVHYASLPGWSRYGRGWVRRVIAAAREA